MTLSNTEVSLASNQGLVTSQSVKILVWEVGESAPNLNFGELEGDLVGLPLLPLVTVVDSILDSKFFNLVSQKNLTLMDDVSFTVSVTGNSSSSFNSIEVTF